VPAELPALLLQSKAAAMSAVLHMSTTGGVVGVSTQSSVTTIKSSKATRSWVASPNSTPSITFTETDPNGFADDATNRVSLESDSHRTMTQRPEVHD
jgi:hypothetical protein